MITRKEYLGPPPDGVTRDEWHGMYYSQFVTPTSRDVARQILINSKWISNYGHVSRLAVDLFDKDIYLNSIPLKLWDDGTWYINRTVDRPLLKQLGETLTLSFGVCVLKESARQILRETISKLGNPDVPFKQTTD